MINEIKDFGELEQCIHKECAESQMNSEMTLLNQTKDYVITHGCEGYRKQGCYECLGYDVKCKTYTVLGDFE